MHTWQCQAIRRECNSLTAFEYAGTIDSVTGWADSDMLVLSWERMDERRSILTALVKGYVQGVGFRVFIRSAAWRLGVTGYVKNLADGTVKVVASGPKASLDSLLQQIWRGPAGADVQSVDASWTDSDEITLPTPFEVKH
jgi:acylphosphatase